MVAPILLLLFVKHIGECYILTEEEVHASLKLQEGEYSGVTKIPACVIVQCTTA